MSTIKLYSGCNENEGFNMLNSEFKDLTWWSRNYETIDHYYEGFVAELEIDLDESDEMKYIREYHELEIPAEDYTHGKLDILCPEGAVWYCISGEYIKKNMIAIKEIELEDCLNEVC